MLTIIIIIIIIIRRQFLTHHNTTDKSLQGRASMQWLMTCHTEIIQCLDTYQLGAVSGEEERLQGEFKTVNRLLGCCYWCTAVVNYIAVMKLFIMSMRIQSPAVLECISLPCLRILQHIINPSPPASKKNKVCLLGLFVIMTGNIHKLQCAQNCLIVSHRSASSPRCFQLTFKGVQRVLHSKW